MKFEAFDLGAPAARAASLLLARRERIAVAESSSGGLVCAALLAVPGASAWFTGGGVIYTGRALKALLAIERGDLSGMRSSSEPYAAFLAETVRLRHRAAWGISETGAAGPTPNGYGDPAGHTCCAVSGPVSKTLTLRTGSARRDANMWAFAEAALLLLAEALEAAPAPVPQDV